MTVGGQPMRVLLVEDDPMIARGLQNSVAAGRLRGGRRERRAPRGRGAAYRKLRYRAARPRASRRGGLEVLRELRGRGDSTPVIIVTARDDIRNRIEGLDAGADDYIIKPFDLDEIAARMRSVLRRAAGRGDPCIRHGGIALNPVTHTVERDGVPIPCRRTNFPCWKRCCSARGRCFPGLNSRTGCTAGGDSIESNAVEVYIHALRRKFGSDSIRTLRGVGYFIPK